MRRRSGPAGGTAPACGSAPRRGRHRLAVVALTALLTLAVSVAFAAGRSGEGPERPPAAAHAADPAAQRAALEQAFALVSWPGRLGHRIVIAQPRPGVRAETNAGTRTITIFLDPADPPHRVAHDIAHELGHAWEAAHLDDAARRAYLRARGVPAAAWWPANGRADYATGAGDFAEVFARCHAASPDFRSRLAAPPADACAALPPGAGSAW